MNDVESLDLVNDVGRHDKNKKKLFTKITLARLWMLKHRNQTELDRKQVLQPGSVYYNIGTKLDTQFKHYDF